MDAGMAGGRARARNGSRAAADRGADILGRRVAAIRRARGLTLRELARHSGLSESTLSRLENNQVMISAHSLIGLAHALGVDIAALFQADAPATIRTGRRTITRAGQGIARKTDRYRFELLCADLVGKKMVPSLNRVTARTLEEAGGLRAHSGEEFIHAISGSAMIHTEFYEPVELRPGDSLYIDSTMAHAYTRGGAEEAVILVVTTTGVSS